MSSYGHSHQHVRASSALPYDTSLGPLSGGVSPPRGRHLLLTGLSRSVRAHLQWRVATAWASLPGAALPVRAAVPPDPLTPSVPMGRRCLQASLPGTAPCVPGPLPVRLLCRAQELNFVQSPTGLDSGARQEAHTDTPRAARQG